MIDDGRGRAVPGAPPSVVLVESERRRLERLRRFAWVLDAGIRIPGTAWTIGLDPIIGLVPGAGDAIGALCAGYIVVQAARSGASIPVLLRMLTNLAIDALGGAVPVVGDLFDAAWKANVMNVRLLEDYLADPASVHRASARRVWGVAFVGGLALFTTIAGAVYIAIRLVRLLLGS